MPRLISAVSLLILIFCFSRPVLAAAGSRVPLWPVQSVDTMKYSRDMAREKLTVSDFDAVIDQQISAIASTGATHVAIDTPYDVEFIPFLTRWVRSARVHHLKVWFRGNWSGWEGWFDYPAITRDLHLLLTKDFILNNPDLFADGDIFTSCPECENGGPGDPRQTGDVAGFREFLIDSYHACLSAFSSVHKQVTCNYFSSNGDVIKQVMNRDTTAALGGVIAIDHYVDSPQRLIDDIYDLVNSSGATQVILGEFGAPILDINGAMTPDEQADWLKQTLALLSQVPEVKGLNYWTNMGSSTSLWEENGQPLFGVLVLTHFYTPRQIFISMVDEFNSPLSGIQADYAGRRFTSDLNGLIRLPYISGSDTVQIFATGYISQGLTIGDSSSNFVLTLSPSHPSLFFRLRKLTYNTINAILHR